MISILLFISDSKVLTKGISLYFLLFSAHIGYIIALFEEWKDIQLFGNIESGFLLVPGS